MSDKTSSLVFLNYLTTVFDNINDAILLIGVEPDDTYRLLLANAAYARNTGRKDVPTGKTLEEIVAPETYELLKPRYQKVVETKQPLTYKEWYVVPLGKQAYEVKLIPILNAVGQCAQIAGITRNITEVYELREKNTALLKQLNKLKSRK